MTGGLQQLPLDPKTKTVSATSSSPPFPTTPNLSAQSFSYQPTNVASSLSDLDPRPGISTIFNDDGMLNLSLP